MARGGKRTGAGRKKSDDPTITIRIPLSKKYAVKQWIQTGEMPVYPDPEEQSGIMNALSILQDALKLKANAGGKIKTEIRRVIHILQQSRQ